MNPYACQRYAKARNRREFLEKSAFGFGSLALGYLLDQGGFLQATPAGGNPDLTIGDPLAAKPQHFPVKAKSVIFIFMQGGPSQVDTFDPKPELKRLEGQPLPPSFQSEDITLAQIKASESKLMGSSFAFPHFGQSGLQMAEIFQHLGQHVDDLAIIRSCYHDNPIHGPALSILHTGSVRLGHPSMGSWVLYGLGAETENLPAYVVMTDSNLRNSSLFSSGFLPAVYQGTLVQTEGVPFENLSPPPQVDQERQRQLFEQARKWNLEHLEGREDDTRLSARIASYELAFRMQMAAPELADLSEEPAYIQEMYGLDNEVTAKFGRMCLLARRMVERGVRFVQLYNSGWDGHAEVAKNHWENAQKTDKPMGALLTDLKQRGLLESTLVVSTGEFGRTPVMQGKQGRDHSPYGFSTWMAGGGIRGGKVIGATDELGFRAVEDKVHVPDLHATMLWLLGLDHEKVTFPIHGLEEKLTGVVKVENNLYHRLIQG